MYEIKCCEFNMLKINNFVIEYIIRGITYISIRGILLYRYLYLYFLYTFQTNTISLY